MAPSCVRACSRLPAESQPALPGPPARRPAPHQQSSAGGSEGSRGRSSSRSWAKKHTERRHALPNCVRGWGGGWGVWRRTRLGAARRCRDGCTRRCGSPCSDSSSRQRGSAAVCSAPRPAGARSPGRARCGSALGAASTRSWGVACGRAAASGRAGQRQRPNAGAAGVDHCIAAAPSATQRPPLPPADTTAHSEWL